MIHAIHLGRDRGLEYDPATWKFLGHRMQRRLKFSRWCGMVLPMATDVLAHITGTIWKIEVKEGEAVTEGQTVAILESMKMEMPVEAPCDGKVEKIVTVEGQAVNEGDVLLTLA